MRIVGNRLVAFNFNDFLYVAFESVTLLVNFEFKDNKSVAIELVAFEFIEFVGLVILSRSFELVDFELAALNW